MSFKKSTTIEPPNARQKRAHREHQGSLSVAAYRELGVATRKGGLGEPAFGGRLVVKMPRRSGHGGIHLDQMNALTKLRMDKNSLINASPLAAPPPTTFQDTPLCPHD
jgi:hypothetical protein